MPRNPPWSVEELTLALDLYLRRGLVAQSDPELINLSKLLNALRGQGAVPDADRYRNPNSVLMKLSNFRAQHHPGQGLEHGNQLEPAVWERFATDPDLLAGEVARIKATLAHGLTIPQDPKSGRPLLGLLEPFVPKADLAHVRRTQSLVRTVNAHHETLVNSFAEWLTALGFKPGRNLAIDVGLSDPPVIVEAEYVVSWAHSIREAVGQLYEYRYFKVAKPETKLVFLASQEVPEEWINYLEDDRDVATAWSVPGGFTLTEKAREAFGL